MGKFTSPPSRDAAKAAEGTVLSDCPVSPDAVFIEPDVVFVEHTLPMAQDAAPINARLILSGLIAAGITFRTGHGSPQGVASKAVELADAILAELRGK